MRRIKMLLAMLGAVAVGAGIAWAVLAVVKTTATDTVTAKSIGNVDIGNASTVGLFSSSLGDIEPGYSKTECTNALVAAGSPGNLPRLWFSGVGGNLADDLQIKLEIATAGVTTSGNVPTCPTGTYTEVYTGTVANLLSTKGSYVNGIPWPNINTTTGAGNVQVRVTLSLPANVDPTTVMGDTAAFAGNFENRTAT